MENIRKISLIFAEQITFSTVNGRIYTSRRLKRPDALNFRRFIRLTFNASALFPVFILDV